LGKPTITALSGLCKTGWCGKADFGTFLRQPLLASRVAG
jgi:hypothetical protein